MKKPEVTILMATFNGADYIGEQLDSLSNQTYPHWRLIIHDDGSTDDTVAIANEYCAKDRRMMLLADGVTNQGAVGNYLHLLNEISADLYLFCDQDDIWLPHKIERMVEVISSIRQPALVYANGYFYRSGKVLSQKTTAVHPRTLRDSLFFNSGIQGCSTIINAQLLALLKPFPKQVAMHDHLLTMAAVAFGKISYIDEVLTCYRQHKGNVTGNQQLGCSAKIRSFFTNGMPVINVAHFTANKAFYDRYQALLDEEQKKLFQAYFHYGYTHSVWKRAILVLKNGFSLGDKKGVLLLKTMFRKPIG